MTMMMNVKNKPDGYHAANPTEISIPHTDWNFSPARCAELADVYKDEHLRFDRLRASHLEKGDATKAAHAAQAAQFCWGNVMYWQRGAQR